MSEALECEYGNGHCVALFTRGTDKDLQSDSVIAYISIQRGRTFFFKFILYDFRHFYFAAFLGG